MSKDKFLIVKGVAGLGNRMLGALTGILYARLSGRRLIVDWSDRTYSNNGSNAFPQFFLCKSSGSMDEIPATGTVCPSVWQNRLNEFATNMRTPYKNNTEFWQKTSIDITKLDYDEDILVMWAYHEKVDLLRDYFKGPYDKLRQMSKEEILSMLLQEDLLLQPRIHSMVTKFKNKEFSGKTVGVHIRYSDHRASLFAILKKLNTLLKHESDLRVFLATDNMQIKKMFEENYPGVITTPHWYPKPGSRIHDNRSCPDTLESGIESLIDLYLLAECDYLIIDSSSSFSYLANLLSKTDASKVFDVSRGGKLTPRLRRLSWRLMLKLGLYSWGLNFLSKIERIQRALSR